MSFVFYVFLLFIDEIQLGVCQTAVLDIAVFSTVFRIVFLYRCRYVWIIRSGLGADFLHPARPQSRKQQLSGFLPVQIR